MSSQVRILGIAGSLHRGSYNQAALRAATLLVPENSEIDLFQLDGIPMFNEDDEKRPPASVLELKERIRRADALLIVTLEYNYSIPGVLKNAIDWASRPHGDSAWSGKSAAIMGASLGAIGTARAVPDKLAELIGKQTVDILRSEQFRREASASLPARTGREPR